MIVLDGVGLGCDGIAALAHRRDDFRLGDGVLAGVARTAEYAATAADQRPVYGRTTGVGANRAAVVDDPAAHAAGLLHSHATGAGPRRSRDRVRAMLAVRLNQLAAGGSGVAPGIVEALAALLGQDALPPVRELGSIGTGDLPALAVTALALAGEVPTDPPFAGPHVRFGAGDALPFLSSNAAALGDAALAVVGLRRLATAANAVTALTLVGVDGNLEAYSPLIEATTPFPGTARVCRLVRSLVGGLLDEPALPARIQDPFGLRVFPQVQGALLDQLDRLDATVTAMVNAAAENPVLIPDVGVAHHGGFYAALLAQNLDATVLAATQSAQLSLARTTMFSEPELTGLTPFLGDPASPGASGVMIVEYVAASAVSTLRHLAQPATLQTVTLSRGAEEDASFASLAARQAYDAVAAYRTVLACELVGALRCLRMRGLDPAGDAPTGKTLAGDVTAGGVAGDLPTDGVRAALSAVRQRLDAGLADRDLTVDVEQAEAALDLLAEVVAAAER